MPKAIGIPVRIEQAAYGNRWRFVSPGAKAGFALAGLLAAFLAHAPQNALGVALLLAGTTIAGAGVAWRLYLRVAAPAVLFLFISCLTLPLSLSLDSNGTPGWRLADEMVPDVLRIATRALAALAALLSLVLTTPLPDLIALLRRLKTPEILLDLMLLCYRMLFVFAQTAEEMLSAQAARLGYRSRRQGLQSLGLLIANLAVQIWLRAQALQQASTARNGDGPLRFLTPVYPQAGRDRLIALLAGVSLIIAAMRLGTPA